MINSQIIDEKIMEEFFKANLNLFENSKRLISLKIFQHDPSLVISHEATLVKYRLELETDDNETQIIILRGSSDPKEKRLNSYKILKSLRENGFDQGHFVVPKPFGYFPELKLLLYENYGAVSLMQRFQSGQNHYLEKIQSSLDWLAAFHSNKPKNIEDLKFDGELEKTEMEHLIAGLCKKFPAEQESIKSARARLEAIEKNLLDAKSFTLVHGDFQPNNILIGDGQISVIDFNDAAVYEELFDLAYFSTQTKYIYRRFRGADISNELELLELDYLKSRKIPYDAVTQKKLALFRAKTLLRIKILTSHPLGKKILDEIEQNLQKAI